MSDKSNIEWTDATWPIVQGCDPVSEGCVHCYAVPLLWRLAHNPNETISAPLQGLTEKHRNRDGEDILRFTSKLALREDRLDWPLKWKKPRKIFVPSHGDIFHKDVPDSFLDKIFSVMARCPYHTFQVLTKRPERMLYYVTHGAVERVYSIACRADETVADGWRWPLENVWAGTSCERQQEADERIPLLLDTPAAVRFISAEPLLGPIDLMRLCILPQKPGSVRAGIHVDVLRNKHCESQLKRGLGPLDWVIVGGESGRNARPMLPGWARGLRDQCEAVGVSYFFKQWGEYGRVGDQRPAPDRLPIDADCVTRVGKKRAGRLLDGREHNEFPRSKMKTV